MIAFQSSVRVWLAVGRTDMRRGMNGLALQVQQALGRDPHDLSIDMFPEDGCLHVYGVGEEGVTAFTQDGIDNLKQIIADEREAGKAPPKPGNAG
jgi:hypothetical protein